MSSTNITDEDVAERLAIVQAGIKRFFSEGFYNWSRETFTKALNLDISLEDPRIQRTLQNWETIGVIHFVGEEDCYFEVKDQFPNEI